MKNNRLNRRQERFIELYLLGKMPTEAYQEVYGCTKRNAQRSAYRLLENDGIKWELAKIQQQTRDKIQRRFDKLIDRSITIVEDTLNLNENDTSLNSIKLSALQMKLRTAEIVLKRMGFDSGLEKEAQNPVNIVVISPAGQRTEIDDDPEDRV